MLSLEDNHRFCLKQIQEENLHKQFNWIIFQENSIQKHKIPSRCSQTYAAMFFLQQQQQPKKNNKKFSLKQVQILQQSNQLKPDIENKNAIPTVSYLLPTTQ